jgi:threonine dehydrogenase-like Zn-dependent dehydrogenase
MDPLNTNGPVSTKPGQLQSDAQGVIQQIIAGAPAGARMDTDRFEPFFGIVKQINLQFVLAYTAEEFAASLRNIAEGKVDVTPLITGHVGLDGVKGAFAELAKPERHAKVMVDPWA